MMTRFTKIYTWFFLFSCLMMSCSSYDFSGVFSTLPAKPQAGEIVTLLYNPKGTVLEGSNQVSAIVRTYADRDLQPVSMFSMPNNVVDTEEYKMKRKNGEIFWAKFSGELLEDEGSVLWIISDITELQKVKEKIEKMLEEEKEELKEFENINENNLKE